MWYYSQSSGELYHDGEFIGTGYAGHGVGLDNPADQAIPNVGPIPQGQYYIGPAFDHPKTGVLTMRLEPEPGTNTLGRSGFLCHGDNSQANHTASEGCIVLSHACRIQIANSADRQLEILP